ncbi:MAG TPA: hypothetical protein VM677_25100 [Actinokineospora sp.]|nr:hypothetical protein [Actinokineospora sp.]
MSTIVVTAGPASAATVLKDLSWSASEVDATPGTTVNTLTFTVSASNTIRQAKIGMMGASGLASPMTRPIYFGKSGVTQYPAEFVSESDGWQTYRYKFTVPRFANAETATWQVVAVADAELPSGPKYAFTAKSFADTTAPTLTSLVDRNPSPYRFVGPTGTVSEYYLTPFEQGAGYYQAKYTLSGPGGAQLTWSTPAYTSYEQLPYGDNWRFQDVVIPAGTPNGTWRVAAVELSDRVGNHATYADPAVPAITVTDNTDIKVSDLLVKSVDTWREDKTTELTATAVAPSPITKVELTVAAPCVAGAQTLPAAGSTKLSVAIRVPVLTASCAVTSLLVFDELGHVSAFGASHGNAQAPTFTRMTGPAPEITLVSLTPGKLTGGLYTTVEATVNVKSWSPGVTSLSISTSAGSHHSRQPDRILAGQFTFSLEVRPDASDKPVRVSVYAADAADQSSIVSRDIPVSFPAGGGGLVPVSPRRLLDTRNTGTPISQDARELTIDGVPADATAVVLNVTATEPTAASFMTVWPDGTARPNTSNLNFVAGQTTANLVTVPVSNGKVRLYNGRGSAHAIVDLFGYYHRTAQQMYTGVQPRRALDTRVDWGGPTRHGLENAFQTGAPDGATAVLVNLTVTGATGPGYITLYGLNATRPGTSNINYTAGWTGANQVLIPLAQYYTAGVLYSHGADVHVIIDVVGYFKQSMESVFVPAQPRRVLDTRGAAGIGQREARAVEIPGLPAGTKSVVLNVTATEATARSHLTVFPYGSPNPNTSNLNFEAGQTVPNQVTVPVVDGKILVYNNSGTTHVVVDLFGYYLS